MRPERIEVMLSSDRRREHGPELRARLVAKMMSGQVAVSELSRREGICTSVLHRWHRQARVAAGLPVPAAAQRLVPVRIALPAPAEAARPAAGLEVVLGNGRVLRVPAGVDPALVAQMAAALER
jgi:transposase